MSVTGDGELSATLKLSLNLFYVVESGVEPVEATDSQPVLTVHSVRFHSRPHLQLQFRHDRLNEHLSKLLVCYLRSFLSLHVAWGRSWTRPLDMVYCTPCCPCCSDHLGRSFAGIQWSGLAKCRHTTNMPPSEHNNAQHKYIRRFRRCYIFRYQRHILGPSDWKFTSRGRHLRWSDPTPCCSSSVHRRLWYHLRQRRISRHFTQYYIIISSSKWNKHSQYLRCHSHKYASLRSKSVFCHRTTKHYFCPDDVSSSISNLVYDNTRTFPSFCSDDSIYYNTSHDHCHYRCYRRYYSSNVSSIIHIHHCPWSHYPARCPLEGPGNYSRSSKSRTEAPFLCAVVCMLKRRQEQSSQRIYRIRTFNDPSTSNGLYYIHSFIGYFPSCLRIRPKSDAVVQNPLNIYGTEHDPESRISSRKSARDRQRLYFFFANRGKSLTLSSDIQSYVSPQHPHKTFFPSSTPVFYEHACFNISRLYHTARVPNFRRFRPLFNPSCERYSHCSSKKTSTIRKRRKCIQCGFESSFTKASPYSGVTCSTEFYHMKI